MAKRAAIAKKPTPAAKKPATKAVPAKAVASKAGSAKAGTAKSAKSVLETAKPTKAATSGGKAAVKSASAKGTSESASKAASDKTTSAKTQAAQAGKTSGKQPAKPTAKEGAKARASEASKPDAKLAAKPAKAQGKSESKPAGKAESKAGDAKGESKADSKGAARGETAAVDPSANGAAGKPARKGITIVSPKPVKKAKPKMSTDAALSHAGRLLDPKNPFRKPLIPSGPSAAAPSSIGTIDADAKLKSPFGKRELDRYRSILLRKRGELVGDVADLEQQALQGASGSLSHTPQHMAEQGSEAYDQSLQLDLAAADRKLIREIDDALKRIDAGSYGVCELTGVPISTDRLEELPWARYSIEAAREIERRSHRA